MANNDFNNPRSYIEPMDILALEDWLDDLQAAHDSITMLFKLETFICQNERTVWLNTIRLITSTIDDKLQRGREMLP